MSKNYHFIVFEQNDMFKSQTIEELLRERANYYIIKIDYAISGYY